MGFNHARYVRRVDDQALHINYPDGSRALKIWEASAGFMQIGSESEQLLINAEAGTSGYPYIKLRKENDTSLFLHTNRDLEIWEAAVQFLKINYDSDIPQIEAVGTNKDLMLKPNGTGNIRFGTYAAITAETNAGFITIKDEAGNARKVCVVA